MRPPAAPRPGERSLSPALDRRFEAIVFDWDGTAVADRRADAAEVRRLVESLCALGMEVAVVSGTHLGNVDGQLCARPPGPGRLHLCLNRGSEVFLANESGVRLIHRHKASTSENAALTTAAHVVVERLAERGLEAEIVARRLNRRKIDLIPEPAWADPPKAGMRDLLAAVEGRLLRHGLGGLPEVVELARAAAAEAGLPAARVTSDAKHVEIGLTDKSDSAGWIFDDLRAQGIGSGLVLVVGDEFGSLGGLPGSDSLLLVKGATRTAAVSVGAEPAGVPLGVLALGRGPAAFLELLEDQLRRRRERAVPEIDPDPTWTLAIGGIDPELERVHGALLTLADGRIGTRGSPLLADGGATPGVLAAGVYRGEGAETELLPCPLWQLLPGGLDPDAKVERVLDLRGGSLRQELTTPRGGVRALLFSSLARPGVVALRAEGPTGALGSGPPLRQLPGTDAESGDLDGRPWLRSDGASGGVAVVAAESRIEQGSGFASLERLASYRVDPARKPAPRAAARRLAAVESVGFEHLLREHRVAWARRWADSDVVIEGDDELQRAVRLCLFHLMASTARAGEAAVGARGLSGPGYRGHVFWDTDVFVLPFLAATHPRAARALLEYRIRRLPAALAAARAKGLAGARFPWESAASGFDVTPRLARDRAGRVIPIGTGRHEEHIVADVAWAAACYIDWAGDELFARGPGAALLVETARYWASRISVDPAGRGHIYGVIGPDEYHGPVDDNAFTNVMARWNLRRAARAVGEHAAETTERREAERWLALAEALVDGYDERTGLYEQFAGFFGLEPLVIADVAPRRPIEATLLLGEERVSLAQVVKQADVLMLHHLLPQEVAQGSLVPNLLYYEPRTAHGSSLSPGIHAALLARAGRVERAAGELGLAARIDLDDLTGTTAAGLHLGAMGSVWQALAFGFAGVAVRDSVLHADPRLPMAWSALELRLRFRGNRVRLRIEPECVQIEAERPLLFWIAGAKSPTLIRDPQSFSTASELVSGERGVSP